jgi:hypothetical protein
MPPKQLTLYVCILDWSARAFRSQGPLQTVIPGTPCDKTKVFGARGYLPITADD